MGMRFCIVLGLLLLGVAACKRSQAGQAAVEKRPAQPPAIQVPDDAIAKRLAAEAKAAPTSVKAQLALARRLMAREYYRSAREVASYALALEPGNMEAKSLRWVLGELLAAPDLATQRRLVQAYHNKQLVPAKEAESAVEAAKAREARELERKAEQERKRAAAAQAAEERRAAAEATEAAKQQEGQAAPGGIPGLPQGLPGMQAAANPPAAPAKGAPPRHSLFQGNAAPANAPSPPQPLSSQQGNDTINQLMKSLAQQREQLDVINREIQE